MNQYQSKLSSIPPPLSIRRPHRRGTGPPGRITGVGKQRSASYNPSTFIPPHTSTPPSADRLSIISESTNSQPSHRSSFSRSDSSGDMIEEPSEMRGNYEVVDILPPKTTTSSHAAPQYPAPLPPMEGSDVSSDDDQEDLHDYEKVRLGEYTPVRESAPDYSNEFATLPLKKNASQYTSSSSWRIPRQTSMPGLSHQTGYPPQPSSPPPSPPQDSNFGMLSFPVKPKSRSASPPPVADDEPIFEDMETIQRKVFQGMVPPPEAPPISTIPTIAAGGLATRPPDQSYFDHLFPSQTPPNAPPTRPLPPDPPMDSDVYWDHLVGHSNQSNLAAVDSEYSLVQQWTDHTDGGGGAGGRGSIPNNDSTYDLVREGLISHQSKKDTSVSWPNSKFMGCLSTISTPS